MMYRTRFFVALLAVLAIVNVRSAAKDAATRNPDRDRWLREHREEKREDADRERSARQAMQRWDREHNRRPTAVKHQDPQKAFQKTSSHKRTAKKQRKRSVKTKQHHAAAQKKNAKLVAER